jgi:beta-lactamase class D
MIRASALLLGIVCALWLARHGATADPLEAAAAPVADCFIVVTPGAAPMVSDAAECGRPTAPASTFKVPHALVALQTGVITAETKIDSPAAPSGFASWRGAHTVDSAIKWSVLPFFLRTAELIGPARMVATLEAIGYGHDTFDASVPQFWITGELVISPLEQLAFLQRFFAGTLPVATEHMALVCRALTMPEGRITNASGVHRFGLAWPPGAVVRAKTGNTRVAGERVSWLVGAVEWRQRDYVFVARRRSTGDLESTAGADVALRGLNALRPEVRTP